MTTAFRSAQRTRNKQDVDYVFYELARSICPECRRVIDAQIILRAELLVKLKQIDLPGADFDQAKTLARAAADAVRAGQLCYAIVVATKPA